MAKAAVLLFCAVMVFRCLLALVMISLDLEPGCDCGGKLPRLIERGQAQGVTQIVTQRAFWGVL